MTILKSQQGGAVETDYNQKFQRTWIKNAALFYSLASGAGAEVSSEGSRRLCDPADVQAANRG